MQLLACFFDEWKCPKLPLEHTGDVVIARIWVLFLFIAFQVNFELADFP